MTSPSAHTPVATATAAAAGESNALSVVKVPGSNPSEDDPEALRLVQDTNALLQRMGFGDRAFSNAGDLVASVSSMSVALYEKLFQFRLRDVERAPRTRQHYEHNAQLVADALRGALLDQSFSDVEETLTGKRICGGDLRSIRCLLQMLERVYELLFDESQDAGVGERLRSASFASAGMSAAVASPSSSVASRAPRRRIPPKTTKKQRPVASKSREDCESERTHRRGSQAGRDEATACVARRSRPLSRGEKQEEVRGGRSVAGDGTAKRIATVNEKHKKRTRLQEQTPKTAREERSDNPVGYETSMREHSHSHDRSELRQSLKEQWGSGDEDAMPAGLKKENRAALKNARFVAPDTKEEDAETPEDERDPFFGGVSSVEHNSETSLHFLEEDGDFADNFSATSIDGLLTKKEEKLEESMVHTGSKSAKVDGRRESAEPTHAVTTGTAEEPSIAAVPPMHGENKNEQEDAEDIEDESRTSPVRKKVARDEPRAPERASSASRVTKRGHAKPLYPLQTRSRRHPAISKAETQYLRYKLSLKNHLQELRQRETAQRQHMARAYKSGEHTANVDKIRARRFEQDVRLHRIAVGLEAKEEEEKHLRHAMHHLLDLEKQKLREEHRVTSSVLQQLKKEHAEREQALENFYADQIELVKEQTQREVHERELVEKAQRQASEKMMRELRRDRESQLAALLQEKQHLAETRQFRQAAQLARVMAQSDERSAAKTDAFYSAAMKARERHATTKRSGGRTSRRTTLGAQPSRVKPSKREQQAAVARLSRSVIR